MSKLKQSKIRLTKTSNQLKAIFPEVRKLDTPFNFPQTFEDLRNFIPTERNKLIEAHLTLKNLVKSVSLATVSAWQIVEDNENEGSTALQLELEEHLEKNTVIDNEITADGLLTRVEYRLRELEEQEKAADKQAQSAPVQLIPANQVQPQQVATSKTLKMPKIEIPEFSGDIRSFSSYWTTFKALVHDKDDTTQLEKFLYLKQSLKGNASKAIASLPVLEANYDEAITLLKARYDRGSCTTDLIISDITKLRPAGKESFQCRTTLDTLMSKFTALKCQGVELDGNPVWRGIILSKFPFHINKQVLTEERDNEEAYTVSSILGSISEIIALNESIELTTAAHTDSSHHQRSQEFNKEKPRNSFQNRRENGAQRDKKFDRNKRENNYVPNRLTCICGDTGHSPFKCQKFSSVSARRQELKRTNACWNCFDKGHNSNQCTRSGKCPTCGDNHHSSVCFEKEKQQTGSTQPTPKSKVWEKKPYSSNNAVKPSQNGERKNQSYTAQDGQTDMVSTSQTAREEHTKDSHQVILMTATALAFNEHERDYQPVTIFIDSGAQRSFITSELSTVLQLPVKANRDYSVSGIGEIVTTFTTEEVDVTLKSPTNGMKLKDIMMYTKPKLTAPIKTAILSEKDKQFIQKKQITIAHPSLTPMMMKPAILIGQDLLARVIETNKPAITMPSGLQLTPTVFGYAISGRGIVNSYIADKDQCTEYSALEIASPVINEAFDTFKQDIKNLYEIEALGIKSGRDENDEEIIKFMTDYRKSIEITDNTATAGFPFLDTVETLKDNYNVAFKRLQHLMTDLKKDPEKRAIYDQTLRDYESQGIIEEVSRDALDGDYSFYLPHRHVWTPLKSTQLRIVFDASSHARGELSLNQVVFEGHSLTSLIHEILMNFRCHKLVMISDIAKAFLQVRLPVGHRDVTRFLWSHDLTKDPGGNNLKVFRFTRVPFGINASPAILNQVIMKHLESVPSETNTEIAKTLYVDNVLLSATTEEELLQKYKHSKETFAALAMNLRDSKAVNAQIPEADRAKKSVNSVLGMIWDSQKDTFTMTSTQKCHKKVSKRTVLSQINGLCYDPLGLLTPILVKAKIFLQDLHKEKISWDQQLSEENTTRWKLIEEEMLGFTYEVPRKITESENVTSRTMSLFVDSSKRMYAAAVYVTTTMIDGSKNTVLYTAKSKVSPMKKELTIPRLELLAIHIGLNLLENAIANCGHSIDRVDVFSDSTIALAWVKLEKRLPSVAMMIAQKIQLARSRLQEKREVHFHHVPTAENIADVATRGLTQEEAVNHTWWTGPEWLNRPEDHWPVNKIQYITDDEVNAIVTAITVSPAKKLIKPARKRNPVPRTNPKEWGTGYIDFGATKVGLPPKEPMWPVEKFSNLNKLKRVVSYSMRFVDRCRNTLAHFRRRKEVLERYKYGHEACNDFDCEYCFEPIQDMPELGRDITATEMIRAENLLIEQEQRVTDLTPMIQSAKNPQIQYDCKILRKYSRLDKASLRWEAKAPAYLPKRSSLSKLIMRHVHETNAHCGAQQLTAEMRQRFWLPHDRAMAKKIVRDCTVCRRHNGLPFRHPLSGAMPEERVTEAPPFAHTGVDLMGPLTVKEAGKDVKRWVALYTCLVTRLVHLEVVSNLSAKAFLLTLKRFIARRGRPTKLISDNGSNFRLSALLLEENIPCYDHEERLSTYLAEGGIEWNFIPPASPWMGGAWERMVGIVKKSFMKTVGKRKLDIEALQTVLCEVEAITNSRPLTYIGEDGCDILRPVDFIHKKVRFGHDWKQLESDENDPTFHNVEITSHKEAKTAIASTEQIGLKYWKIWQQEYLLELRERQKGLTIKNRSTNVTPKVGEIVIVDEDDDLPRGEWRLARITQLVRSRDGNIRSAMIKFANGREVQRPVLRLVSLEIRAETPLQPITVVTKEPTQTDTDESKDTRTQPARAAKTAAIKRNRGIDLNSLAIIMSVVCCLTMPSVGAHVLSCTNGGVTINGTAMNQTTETELCVNNGNCVRILCPPETIHYQVPLAQSIHEFSVQWRTIVNGTQYYESATCRGGLVCELINCFFCSEMMGNPHCWPKTAIATLMLTAYLVLTALIVIWKLCIGHHIKTTCQKITRKMGTNLIRTSRKLKKRRDRSDDETDEEIPLIHSKNSRAERSRMIALIAVISLVAILIQPTDACQSTHIIDSSQLTCTDNLMNTSNCINQNERTVSLSNIRREVCLRTKRDNVITGQIKLTFKYVRLVCNPVVKYWTRNVQMETISVKRCSLAGSCTSGKCAEITSQTFIPELNETFKHPGISRCAESCGGIYCGCLLPTPGCLFSRTIVKAQDETIYRMITCPTWTQSVTLVIERLFANGSVSEQEVSLRTEVSKKIMNATVTIEWVNTPNIPLLNTLILQGEGDKRNVSMMIPENEESGIVCPSMKTAKAMSLCHVPDLCHCSSTETTANCNCRAMNISKYANSLEHRLPISSENMNMEVRKGVIIAYSHQSIAEVSISNFELTTEIVTHNDSCKVAMGEAQGCFNCIRGATVPISCYAKRRRTATITCGDLQLVTACGPETIEDEVSVHVMSARLDEICTSDCSGANTFSLQGTLAYHSLWNDYEQINKRGAVVSLINIPDLTHVLTVMNDWWKTSLISIICLAIAIGATLLIGPCIVEYAMYRITRGCKAKRK